MKVNNLKLSAAFLSIVVAGGITIGSLNNCYAETYKPGTFITEQTEVNDVKYNQYVVKKGDTLSNISIKVCKFFNEEKSTKYWPALAFLNNYPRIVKPGDILIFPETYDQLVQLNSNLRKMGWTARYIQGNNIYNEEDSYLSFDIYKLLEEIYGIEITDDLVNNYLECINFDSENKKYNLNSIDNETLFALTEWIPPLEDIGYRPGLSK